MTTELPFVRSQQRSKNNWEVATRAVWTPARKQILQHSFLSASTNWTAPSAESLCKTEAPHKSAPGSEVEPSSSCKQLTGRMAEQEDAGQRQAKQ